MATQDQNGISTPRQRSWHWVIIGCAATAVLVVMIGVIALAGVVIVRRHGTAHDVITSTQALPIGSSTHAIAVGGLQRTYIVYRPAGLPENAPLVVMLHGGYGSASQAESTYGWNAEADRQRFLVAYPDGLHRAWNTGGGCCGQPAAINIDDVGFISAMVQQIELKVSVDPSRIYATGISNGGIMAYTLACQTTLFAAIGPDSATQLGPCTHPNPTSIIHIHGTADTHIRYNGGEGTGVAHINGPAIPALNATWRTIDQCGTPSVTVNGVVTTSVANCAEGRVVELITIEGAGHQWPGAPSKPIIQKLLGTDPPSAALNATDTIWQFFAQHHK